MFLQTTAQNLDIQKFFLNKKEKFLKFSIAKNLFLKHVHRL